MYEAEAELEQLLRRIDRQVASRGEAMIGAPFNMADFDQHVAYWLNRLRSPRVPASVRIEALNWAGATADQVRSQLERMDRTDRFRILTGLAQVNRAARRGTRTPSREPAEVTILGDDAWSRGAAALPSGRRANRGPDSVPPTRHSRSDPPPPPRRPWSSPPPPPSSPPSSRGPAGTQRSPGVQPPPPPQPPPSTLRTGQNPRQREAEEELSRVLRQVDRVAAEAEFEAGLSEEEGEAMFGFFRRLFSRTQRPAQTPDVVLVSPSDPGTDRQTPVPPSQLSPDERRLLQDLRAVAGQISTSGASQERLRQFQAAYQRASAMSLPIPQEVRTLARRHGIA